MELSQNVLQHFRLHLLVYRFKTEVNISEIRQALACFHKIKYI
jgi:hypothetical protein